MRRRDFIAAVGVAAVVWPFAVPPDSRTVATDGVLLPYAENDSEAKSHLSRSLRSLNDSDRRRAGTSVSTPVLRPEWQINIQHSRKSWLTPTGRVPFRVDTRCRRITAGDTRDSDRVYRGLRPGRLGFRRQFGATRGNLTGMMQYESGIVGKWLQMLKEIAPHLGRAAFVANPKFRGYDYFLRSADAAAPALAIELIPSPSSDDAADIEHSIELFAQTPDGGLLIVPDATIVAHRDLIIALAARYRLPAVYPWRYFVAAGALMSYGIDNIDVLKKAALYVHRILNGAKPVDLPVQARTKFETVINLKPPMRSV